MITCLFNLIDVKYAFLSTYIDFIALLMHLKYIISYSPRKLIGRHLSRYSTMASTLMFLPSLFVIRYFHICPSTTCCLMSPWARSQQDSLFLIFAPIYPLDSCGFVFSSTFCPLLSLFVCMSSYFPLFEKIR